MEKKILGQIIATTKEDLHGEIRPREVFEQLIASYPKKMPIHQQHNMSLDPIGHMENLRVESDPSDSDHFVVRADIYLTSDDVNPNYNGFSLSFLETIYTPRGNPSHRIYLPFPLYNDEEFNNNLIENHPNIVLGKLVQKSLSNELIIGLVGTAIALLFGPEWDIQYRARVRPSLIQLVEIIRKINRKGASVNLMQVVLGPKDEEIQIVFIPRRGSEVECLNPELIEDGLRNAYKFLTEDSKSVHTGVCRIKLYFGENSSRFYLLNAEYRDGTVKTFKC